jgi:hypothetical protein
MTSASLAPRAAAAPDASPRGRQLQALSADAALLQSLAQRRGMAARIHSVFDHVVNVELDDERLLTLAQRDSDDAPETIVADVGGWSSWKLLAGSTLHLSAEQIVFGNGLVVALGNARRWQCQLPAYAQDETALAANLVVARHHLERHGQGIGLERSLAGAATPFEKALVEAFRENTQGLVRAIGQHDETLACQHAQQLLGLGPGLTPAGDDFLLGLLAVLNIADSPCRQWRRIGAPIVECARRQTNAISLAGLRQAASGRVRDRLVRLCHALMHVDATPMLGVLDRVLSIGSSSGADIALGMLSGFQLHLQTKR